MEGERRIAKHTITVQVTVPPGTSPQAAVTQDVSFPPMEVESIKWRMPHGHAGLVGWAFTDGSGWIYPSTAGQWVIGDGDSGEVSPRGLPDSGGWQVTAYNQGNYPHTIYFTFHLNPIESRPQMRQLIPTVRLNSGGDLSKAGPPVGGE